MQREEGVLTRFHDDVDLAAYAAVHELERQYL
jgi:hypothetical protein